MRAIVAYFAGRPLVANVVMFGLIIASVAFWGKIGKEEMPDFTMNWMRVNVRYPGASAEDVELFIVKPVEEKLKGLSGIDELSSSASFSSASFRITFDAGSLLSEKVQEVKEAVDSVELPREAEEPVYDQFKSSEKAIINVAIYHKHADLLNTEQRAELQAYALAFKNRVISLPEVSGVETRGYLRPEIQILVDPKKLIEFEIPMNQVSSQVTSQNVRTPIGSLRDRYESEITLLSELRKPEAIREVLLASGFEGQQFRLKEVAEVANGFERTTSIQKTQGHESVTYNIMKSVNTDILSAQKAVVTFIDMLKKQNPDSPVGYVLIDDESYDVRNRLSLIGSNGLIGFVLIIFVLFFFLDFKSGLWVAMGIPFSLAFTLVACLVMGETVNNMTLAGIIIVLGIVVDDAIIVAENVTRKKDPIGATMEVLNPIIASILTTVAAFIPLLFFSGRFGLLITVIPTIVGLMLFASMVESFFILPAHMSHDLPGQKFLNRYFSGEGFAGWRENFIHRAEESYEFCLRKILHHRLLLLIGFSAILITSGWLWHSKLNYVMFPREEGYTFSVRVIGPEGASRREMATIVKPVEQLFLNDKRDYVRVVETRIAQSRRGGEVKENEASLRIEILPPSERPESLSQLIREWDQQAQALEGFQEIRILRSRFGSDSGSPIVIEVQENNDERRTQVLERLATLMNEHRALSNVEIEKPVTRPEYRLELLEQKTAQLSVDFSQLSSSLRAFVEGQILYTLNDGDEEIDIRLMSDDQYKRNINDIMKLRVANRSDYLVPIGSLVKVVPGEKPSTIQRINFKRATNIYADLKATAGVTPLEVAEDLESNVFPEALAGNPSTVIRFRGEIEDSRESQSDFSFALYLVLALIYVLLVFLFDSLWTPLLIGAIIPFGVAGVILTLAAHGMWQYGFFAVVGALGMIGVVINDSIVLVDKLENEIDTSLSGENLLQKISSVTATRLRAIVVTTLTTVAGLLPTAYGIGGYDSMLAEMMLSMAWGLLFGMLITLLLVPCIYSLYVPIKNRLGVK